MNFSRMTKGLLLGLALLLATSAFAANKGSIQLLDRTNVGGTQLNPGDYSLKWDGTGSNVQVSVLKGSKVVATTPARLVEVGNAPQRDTAVMKNNADGTKSISQVQFAGKTFALQLGAEGASEAGGSK
jgi:hypothetical protein